jgi:hypothetical protein
MLIKNIIAFFLLVPLVAFAAKPLTTSELEIVRSSNIKVYAFEKVLDRWDENQWYSFNELVKREGSKWNPEAKNPYSSAYGIGQFLDSTWKTVGCTKTSDKYIQINCMLEYITVRYKTPQKALEFHIKNNYY